MKNGWTPERRALQAEMIRQWQPWQYSTGPRTQEGKAKSSRNAFKNCPMIDLKKRIKQLMREVKATRAEMSKERCQMRRIR